MMRFFPLLSSSLFALGLSLTTMACSQPVADDGADDSAGAATIGSRWSSPIEPGKYDADGVTLRVAAYRDRQAFQIFGQAGSRTFTSCEGTADVADGKVKIEDADHSCTLEFVPADGSGVTMTGVVDGRSVSLDLRRRRADSFVGTYATADGAKLTVTRSSEEAITFNLTFYSTIFSQGTVAKDEALDGDWLRGAPDLYELFTGELARDCEVKLRVLRLTNGTRGFKATLGTSTGCDQTLLAFRDLTLWSASTP